MNIEWNKTIIKKIILKIGEKMMKFRKLYFIISMLFICMMLFGCDPITHDPNDIKEYGDWENVDVYYNDIELDWEQGYFVHELIHIDIPQKLKGFKNKSYYDNIDKHDLVYQYKKRTNTKYNGDKEVETKFSKLDHKKPIDSTVSFKINTTDIDIDSKLLIQDEYVNDYYFKYDFNNDYYNYCYFKISNNDINQLKNGDFNEIRLSLTILSHIDGSKSFKTKNEDGITNVGYYDSVGIYYNSDLV